MSNFAPFSRKLFRDTGTVNISEIFIRSVIKENIFFTESTMSLEKREKRSQTFGVR